MLDCMNTYHFMMNYLYIENHIDQHTLNVN
jgi:hypothetical protein